MARRLTRWNTWRLRAAEHGRPLVLLGVSSFGCLADSAPRAAPAPDAAEAPGAASAAAPGAASADAGRGAAAQCLPPRAATCEREARWSRDPQSGLCCEYESPCTAPLEQPAFSTQSECETSCRCADFTPSDFSRAEADGAVTLATERIGLDCGCGTFSCPGSLDEMLSGVCAAPRPATSLVRGCGKVEVRFDGGFTGSTYVFDEQTGMLLGFSRYSDVPMQPCQAYATIAGQQLDCASATACDPCLADAGAAGGGLPACD